MIDKDILAFVLLAAPLIVIILWAFIATIYEMYIYSEWKSLAGLAAVVVWVTLACWLLIS